MRITAAVVACTLATGCALKTPFSATVTADGKYWVVDKPLIYEQPKSKQRFEVPRGFVTDLASVPRMFWSAFPPCGAYTPAAVVHDYIYWFQPENCDRECADMLLLVAMEESNVPFITRNAIYAGVRTGGQKSWDDNRTLRTNGAIRLVPEDYMSLRPCDTWSDIEARVRAGVDPKKVPMCK